MDHFGGASSSPELSAALNNVSAQDKQQLNQFVQNETQKASIQANIHYLTGEWKHTPPFPQNETPKMDPLPPESAI